MTLGSGFLCWAGRFRQFSLRSIAKSKLILSSLGHRDPWPEISLALGTLAEKFDAMRYFIVRVDIQCSDDTSTILVQQ